MVTALEFYQIFYKDEQKEQLYPFAIPFRNERLTPYFENSVIIELVPKTQGDLVSVCSWKLKEKRASSSTEIILKRAGTFELTHESIITNSGFDIAILTPHNSSHQPLGMAIKWHGKAWVDAFLALKIYLHGHHICKVPDELTHTIYENHFIAKREIYCDYVSQCLIPVIEFIRKEEVFSRDSGYITKKKNDPQAIADYQKVSGRTDWPIAPFILERLFSIWIEYRKFKIVNL
jgi:hypothetical protein